MKSSVCTEEQLPVNRDRNEDQELSKEIVIAANALLCVCPMFQAQ